MTFNGDHKYDDCQTEKHYWGWRVINLLLAFFVSLFLTLVPSSAQEASDWLIKKVSGDAWITTLEEQTIEVRKGMYFKPGQTLKTASRSRVLLSRNKERLQVGADTIIRLPSAEVVEPGKTIIKQRRGKIDLLISRKDRKHFSVETPYLAAVVKGTRFSVSVVDQRAVVRVYEGLVGVNSLISDEKNDIRPGQSVSLGNIDGKSSRMLILDTPRSFKSFDAFPEVLSELGIDPSSPGFMQKKIKVEASSLDIAVGFVTGIFGSLAAGAAGIGGQIYSTLSPILDPMLNLATTIYKVISPNPVVGILAVAAILSFTLFVIIMIIRRRS
ncbi:MAG: FecR family protein [Cohaesibacter sp.]|jgi:hypothetical protein|nr:FecR family protein [Cohaesibacter sp.]